MSSEHTDEASAYGDSDVSGSSSDYSGEESDGECTHPDQ